MLFAHESFVALHYSIISHKPHIVAYFLCNFWIQWIWHYSARLISIGSPENDRVLYWTRAGDTGTDLSNTLLSTVRVGLAKRTIREALRREDSFQTGFLMRNRTHATDPIGKVRIP